MWQSGREVQNFNFLMNVIYDRPLLMDTHILWPGQSFLLDIDKYVGESAISRVKASVVNNFLFLDHVGSIPNRDWSLNHCKRKFSMADKGLHKCSRHFTSIHKFSPDLKQFQSSKRFFFNWSRVGKRLINWSWHAEVARATGSNLHEMANGSRSLLQAVSLTQRHKSDNRNEIWSCVGMTLAKGWILTNSCSMSESR
jgi:hypothetical protein